MREIKFRGFDNESGKFVYGWYTKLVEGIRRFDAIITDINGELTRFYIHNPETIGQFTGLLDKNGKEIYEGDILDLSATMFSFKKAKVSFISPNFVLETSDGGYFFAKHDVLEVIGNIYENPELLEGKQ